MSANKRSKVFSNTLGAVLYRAVCILLVITALTSWSVSGLYAKYVSAGSVDENANVARIGIEQFKLIHRAKATTSRDYSKLVPGADIPAPHVSLKINSEVSYTLYLNITLTIPADLANSQSDYKHVCVAYTDDSGSVSDIVYFTVDSSKWVFVKTVSGTDSSDQTQQGDDAATGTDGNQVGATTSAQYTTITYVYKYTTNFVAGTTYDYTTNQLEIITGDVIYVSENYNREKLPANALEFSLGFDLYLKQYISEE